MYKLVVFVPESHLEIVKIALFDAGAGAIGNYDHCCWQVLGQGQFRPLAGSKPFIGIHERLEVVPEYRVEMICAEQYIAPTITALRAAHPYEEPAFELCRLVDPEV
jgi:hypothetical protein